MDSSFSSPDSMDLAGLGVGAGLGYAAATNPDVAKSMLDVGNTAIKTQAKMFPWMMLFMLVIFIGFGIMVWNFMNNFNKEK